jgi:methionyl-tRNA formyltransferase
MGILSNTISSIPQSCYGITYANKLKKHEGLINWNQSYKNIYNKIKAFNPWPGSFTYYNGKLLKLFEPKLSLFQVSKDILPGTIIYIGNELIIACNDACISFGIVQIQGKKPINMNKLLNSNFFNKNDCFNVVLD